MAFAVRRVNFFQYDGTNGQDALATPDNRGNTLADFYTVGSDDGELLQLTVLDEESGWWSVDIPVGFYAIVDNQTLMVRSPADFAGSYVVIQE